MSLLPLALRRSLAAALAAAFIVSAAALPADAAGRPAELQRAARRGDVRAQVALGDWHATGQGKRADWHAAFAWYRRAARRGDAEALAKVAACLEAGRGCRRNVPQAWRYWLAAAHGNDAGVRLQVARRLMRGQGVRRDRALAVRLLTFGATHGDPRAQRELGEALAAGGAEAERLAGLRWLARAALAGEVAAAGAWKRHAAALPATSRARAEAEAAALGGGDAALTAKAARLGLPTPPSRDEVTSRSGLARAARAGSREAMVRLAGRLEAGEGAPADPALARRWLEAAARRGEPTALAKLGTLVAALPVAEREAAAREMAAWALQHPAGSVAAGAPGPAPAEAAGGDAAHLRSLAEAGSPWAQTALGQALARGRLGPPDEAEAATWWLRAAARGDRLAQANLAEAFQAGRGVPQDPVIAYGYWCLATGATPGERLAAYPHAARLGPSAIAEAARQVAAWRRSHDDLPAEPAP